MNMKLFFVVMAAMVLVIGGCAHKTIQTTGPVTPVTDSSLTPGDKSGDAAGRGISEEEMARSERERLAREREEAARRAAANDIMFEFDSYLIQPSEMPKIETISNNMKGNTSQRITAEGHCDERGTIEYNLALGQRRADAVKDKIVKSGIDGSRIKAVSFGKEAPIDAGHGEDAWAKNRRVHVKIDQ